MKKDDVRKRQEAKQASVLSYIGSGLSHRRLSAQQESTCETKTSYQIETLVGDHTLAIERKTTRVQQAREETRRRHQYAHVGIIVESDCAIRVAAVKRLQRLEDG